MTECVALPTGYDLGPGRSITPAVKLSEDRRACEPRFFRFVGRRCSPCHSCGRPREASTARIRPVETGTSSLKPRSDPPRSGSDPQPPAFARSLQAGGHRFDPGWLHSEKSLHLGLFWRRGIAVHRW